MRCDGGFPDCVLCDPLPKPGFAPLPPLTGSNISVKLKFCCCNLFIINDLR